MNVPRDVAVHERAAEVTLRVRKHARAARRVRASNGVGGVAFLVVRRILRLVGIRLEWFRVLEQRPETAAVPGREPLVPTWVEDGGADPAVLSAFGRSPEVVRRRLDGGDAAAVVTDAGVPVAQIWIHAGGVYDEDGVLFPLAPDEAWVFDGVVAEARRGERIYPRLAVGVARDLETRGFVRMLSTIDAVNGPSLRAAAVRGCVVLGTVVVMRAWGLGVLRTRWRGRRPEWRTFRETVSVELPA